MPIVIRTWTVNGARPINPQLLAKDAAENGWPTDWYGLANGLTVPRGWESGYGHFLLSDKDVANLCGPITIAVTTETGTTSFEKWYLESKVAVTKQAKPVWWCRFRDRRWALEDNSTQGLRINLLKSAGDYVDETINSGTPYTWQQVLQLLWAKLPSGIAGGCPALPYSTATIPENLCFDGIPVLRAVQQVLTSIGCCLVLDPIGSQFRIVDLRVSTPLPFAAYRDRLLWRGKDRACVEMPQNVAIQFPMMPGSNPYTPFLERPHTETVVIGGSDGTYNIDDTMFYETGRAAAIATRANEIATSLTWLLVPRDYPFSATYAGFIPFQPNTNLTSVEWLSDGDAGFVTKLRYEAQPIDWPKMPTYFPATAGGSVAVVFELTSDLASGVGSTAWATVIGSSDTEVVAVSDLILVYNTGTAVGLSGARGVAIKFGEQWWVVDLNQPTTLAFFTFLYPTHYPATERDYPFGSVSAQQPITFSGFTSLTPYPFSGLPTAAIANPYNLVALSGDLGLCTRNLATGEYQLIAVHPPKARRFYFKLTADWPNGLRQTSTSATALYPDPINQGGDLNYGTGAITLLDRWDVAHNAKNNDVGLCQLNYTTNQFDIIQIEHEMVRGRGDVYVTESGTPDTIQVENVVSFDGRVPTADPLEIDNELEIESVTGGQKLEIRWNPITGAYYAIPASGGGRVIPVVLEQVGGAQGDNEDPATWTYDVKDFYDTGLVLLEAANPVSSPHKFKRPAVGQMTEATFGYAHYNAEGELILGWINEVPEQEACEPPE